MWNLPAPPGSQGLRDDLPLKACTRSLPHWRQHGATYFVTYRLADSLPQSKLRELRAFKSDWEARHPPPRLPHVLDELARDTMRRVEDWLDQGMGDCVLQDPRAREVVVENLLHFEGERYDLGCFVVMPNHVHAVVRPLDPVGWPLEKILQTSKGYTSRTINQLLCRTGDFWQEESFDRIIRNEEHLYRVVQYIGRNPARAGLAANATRLWIHPSWTEVGWRFEARSLPPAARS